jgi:membrane associated rhomboid family serine protease
MQSRWSTQTYYIPPISENVFRLIALFTAAYFIEVLGKFLTTTKVLEGLALHFGPGFQSTQILTHIFLHASNGFGGFIDFIFKMVLLWSFGSDLERTWGSYKFLTFFFAGLIGGVLLTGFLSLVFMYHIPVIGFGAGLAAIMVGYAMLWPDREVLFFFIFPMKMKWVVLIIFLMMALSGSQRTLIQYSGGALFAAVYLFYYVKKGRLYSHTYPVANKGAGPIQQLKIYLKKRRLEKKQQQINKRIHMKEEVDRILEKISKEGMQSLTRKEKSFLDKASREF